MCMSEGLVIFKQNEFLTESKMMQQLGSVELAV